MSTRIHTIYMLEYWSETIQSDHIVMWSMKYLTKRSSFLVCTACSGKSWPDSDWQALHIKACEHDWRGQDLPNCCTGSWILFSKAGWGPMNEKSEFASREENGICINEML